MSTNDDEWLDWASVRPTKTGFYWWRVPAKNYGGLTLRPEWAEKAREVGVGHGPAEIWPVFSRWDGYIRTVPPGTQWQEKPGIKEHEFVFVGLSLKPCPFCGSAPEVEHSDRSDCGLAIGSPIFRANHFGLRCPCGLAGNRRGTTDFAGLVGRWNTRFGVENEAGNIALISAALDLLAHALCEKAAWDYASDQLKPAFHAVLKANGWDGLEEIRNFRIGLMLKAIAKATGETL